MFDCLIFMSIFVLNTNFQENSNVFGLKNKLGQNKICMFTVTCTRQTLFLAPTLVYFIYKSIKNLNESENGNRIMVTGYIHIMYVV